MELDQTIARVTVDSGTTQIVKIDLHRPFLRFKCQRCAVFCCKLGAPLLLPIDVKRLRRARIEIDRFLNSEGASLRNTRDGACSLLSFNVGEGVHECAIYEHRPTLCRLYPFRFEKSGQDCYTVKLIPCCKGLNQDDGELIDGRFFGEHLRVILREMIQSNAI